MRGCKVRVYQLHYCSFKTHTINKYLNHIASSGLPTLSVLAQAFSWLVAHFLQKFLSNSPCVLFPVTNAFTRLYATCKPLGLVPPEITLAKKKKIGFDKTILQNTLQCVNPIHIKKVTIWSFLGAVLRGGGGAEGPSSSESSEPSSFCWFCFSSAALLRRPPLTKFTGTL